MLEFLSQNKVREITYDDIPYLIECLDLDKDGKISFTDLRSYFDAFKPLLNSQKADYHYKKRESLMDRLNQDSMRKSGFSLEESQSGQRTAFYQKKASLENMWLTYFTELADIVRVFEVERCELSNRSDFNLTEAFEIFELEKRGYLEARDLKYGYNILQIYPTKKELLKIIQVFGNRNSQTISSSFKQLQPVCFSSFTFKSRSC